MLVNAFNITIKYLDKTLFKDASFVINDTDKIGLLGINGAGKSTLIKAIIGEAELDSGIISKKKDFKIEVNKLVDFLGGKVWVEEEYPNILFAKDGEIFDFEVNGAIYKSIVIGGAYSVDKHYRLMMGWSWFSDEQPNKEIKDFVENQLDKHNWDIDIVLSHTCPKYYEPVEWFLSGLDQSTVDKSTEIWLDNIFEKLNFKKWYCGHYHGSKKIDGFQFMFLDFDSFGVED